MTRHTIAFEGKPSILPHIWLAPGSLYIDPNDRIIPVTMRFQSGDIIGTARDLQRDEETGEVSVDVTLSETHLQYEEQYKELYNYTFCATQLVQEDVSAA